MCDLIGLMFFMQFSEFKVNQGGNTGVKHHNCVFLCASCLSINRQSVADLFGKLKKEKSSLTRVVWNICPNHTGIVCLS